MYHIILRGCSYENSFPVVFPLRVHIRNISPPGGDLFWRAIRREKF